MRQRLLWAVLLCAALAGAAVGAEVGGVSPEEALRLGQRMYRDGLLPSGQPMMATVQGDIEVEGTMFTCVSCHMRSGLGSLEGTVVTLPTNGARLYAPLLTGDLWRRPGSAEVRRPVWETLKDLFPGGQVRPAYTDQTLAVALRSGRDPVGRRLDPVMPRYRLSPKDMAIMVHYLKNLSSQTSPGVTASEVRFATVLAAGVSGEERRAYLDALNSYIWERSGTSGGPHGMGKSSAAPKATARRPSLSVWELTGPPETWGGQLEALYRKEPVFALVGGLAAGTWEPVHRFCEERGIPSLFPVTELPVISESDWYTLYFSKGVYQEGEAAARYLNGTETFPADARIVQVFRPGTPGAAAARGFEAEWGQFGRPAPRTRALGPGEAVSTALWNEVLAQGNPAVVMAWLGAADLAALAPLAKGLGQTAVFGSSTLIEEAFGAVPPELRASLYLTYPYSLPDEEAARMPLVERWAASHGLPDAHRRLQARAYFTGYMLYCALMEIRDEFYRDYFVEAIDMMADQSVPVASYPRLSFGPGQRYASKGCHVVQLSADAEPRLVARSGWLVH